MYETLQDTLDSFVHLKTSFQFFVSSQKKPHAGPEIGGIPKRAQVGSQHPLLVGYTRQPTLSHQMRIF